MIKDIKARARHSAQTPFGIRLSDGQTLRVEHPEFMAFPRDGGSFVFLPPSGGVQIVSLNQVVTVNVAMRPKGKRRGAA